MPLGNLALDAARDALTRVLGGACGGGGGRVEPGGDGGLVGGWWWWWCAAVVHVRVDAGVEGVGGAGGVRAVGAFGGGLLHCGCGGFVLGIWVLFGFWVSALSRVVGDGVAFAAGGRLYVGVPLTSSDLRERICSIGVTTTQSRQ